MALVAAFDTTATVTKIPLVSGDGISGAAGDLRGRKVDHIADCVGVVLWLDHEAGATGKLGRLAARKKMVTVLKNA